MIHNKYGCVIFESQLQHDTAWATRMDDDEPVFISGTSELSSDIFWLSNLPYKLHWQSGFSNHTRIISSNYLRLSTERIANQLGIQDNLYKQSLYLSKIFGKIMSMSHKLLGIENDNLESLKKGVRIHAGDYDHAYEDYFSNIIKSATVHFIVCERPVYRTNVKKVFFRIPPVEHVKNILSMPVPVGSWSKINVPSKNEDYHTWAVENVKAPLLCKVRINTICDKVNQIINFGSGAIDNIKRNWISLPELIQLLPVSDLTIEDAYVSQSLVTCKPLLERIESVPDFCNLSYSYGILLDNIWTGITTQHASPQFRQQKHLNVKVPLNHVTPFYKSQDMVLCFMKALEIFAKGYDVLDYGAGLISIDASDLTEKGIVDLARATNLIPPMCSLSPEEDSNADVSNPLGAMQTLFARGMLDELIEADNQVFDGIMKHLS